MSWFCKIPPRRLALSLLPGASSYSIKRNRVATPFVAADVRRRTMATDRRSASSRVCCPTALPAFGLGSAGVPARSVGSLAQHIWLKCRRRDAGDCDRDGYRDGRAPRILCKGLFGQHAVTSAATMATALVELFWRLRARKPFTVNYFFFLGFLASSRAAWAAARRAMGTRKGEQLT